MVFLVGSAMGVLAGVVGATALASLYPIVVALFLQAARILAVLSLCRSRGG